MRERARPPWPEAAGRLPGWKSPAAGRQTAHRSWQPSRLHIAQQRRQNLGEREQEHNGKKGRRPRRPGHAGTAQPRLFKVQSHRRRSNDKAHHQAGGRHGRRRQLHPGAKFRNFCLANFLVSSASPVAESRLESF
jgi:hypothetical protein